MCWKSFPSKYNIGAKKKKKKCKLVVPDYSADERSDLTNVVEASVYTLQRKRYTIQRI